LIGSKFSKFPIISLKFLLPECMELMLFLLADNSSYIMATWTLAKGIISGDDVRRNRIRYLVDGFLFLKHLGYIPTFEIIFYILLLSSSWGCEMFLIHCYLDYTSRYMLLAWVYYICHNMRVLVSIHFMLLRGRHYYYTLLCFSCYSC